MSDDAKYLKTMGDLDEASKAMLKKSRLRPTKSKRQRTGLA